MADNNLTINTGTINAPYQEFTYTIDAGSVLKVNYVTENFALLETSIPAALHVNFGGSANETPFMEGMRYKLPEIVPNVTLINRNDTPLTVHFAVGCGEIDDNRLTVVGSLKVNDFYSNIKTTAYDGDKSLPGSLSISFVYSCVVSGSYERLVIQNTGTQGLYVCDSSEPVGSKNGLLVEAGGNIELPASTAVRLTVEVTGALKFSAAAFSTLTASIKIDEDGEENHNISF